MENANIKLAEKHACGGFRGVKSLFPKGLRRDMHSNETSRALICRDILAPLVFLVIINWAIKKMYAKQHYYAFFFLCRLIIEQKHKILVTHFS
jgi:hypothetical protein